MIELRPYQIDATAALWAWLEANDGNPLVVASVGAGKSLMMAKFIRDCVEGWPDTRIVLATHSAELVRQNFAKLMEIWPGCPAGVYSAGLGVKQINARVLIGTIQSLWRKAFSLQTPSAPDILIVDECHTISRKSQTMWGKFISDLRVMNPELRVVGYSGTHWRLDSGYLHEGDDRMFDGVAYEIGMLELIEMGYLTPLVTVQPDTQIDLSGVHVRGGEYVPAELESAADAITEAAVDEIVRQGVNRKTWLAFCSGRQHAFNVRDAIRARGFSCETVLADTPKDERADILSRLRTGKLRSVTNVSTLTTGVDVPCIDMLAFLRPSKSSSLFTQMAGRGMRLSPGKTDCLVLDFAGLIAEHGPVDQARPKPKRKGPPIPAGAPTKECPECEAECLIAARECTECGYEFPFDDAPKIDASASSLAILSSGVKPQWVEVTSVSYHRHEKPGGVPTMRVDYHCGLVKHSEWICFEHTGYPRQKACAWWNKRAPGWAVPNTVADALDHPLIGHDFTQMQKPIAIQVKPEGKYTSITAFRFGE